MPAPRPLPRHPLPVPTLALTAALVVVLGSTARPVAAQSPWLDRSGPALQLEILKPSLDDAEELSFGSTAWYFGGRARLSADVSLVGELPLAVSGLDEDSNQTGLIVGNPYLGLQIGPASGIVYGDVGMRLPAAPEDKEVSQIVGIFSDAERANAFPPHTWSLRALGTVKSRPSSQAGLYATARLGAELALYTEFPDDEDFWMLWALGGGVEQRSFRVRAEVNNLTLLDELDSGLADASLSQVAVGADFGAGKLRPGISLRAPLNDNLSDVVDAVFGLYLQYAIR